MCFVKRTWETVCGVSREVESGDVLGQKAGRMFLDALGRYFLLKRASPFSKMSKTWLGSHFLQKETWLLSSSGGRNKLMMLI